MSGVLLLTLRQFKQHHFIKFFFALCILWGVGLQPKAVAEDIAVADWDFEKLGTYRLDKDWYVYRDVVLSPGVFQEQFCGQTQQGVAAESFVPPDLWGPALTLDISTGHGKATYCIDIELPVEKDFYTLRLGALRTVSQVYAVFRDWQGDPHTWLLSENGDLQEDARTTVSNPTVAPIELPYRLNRFTLVIQVSNRVHKQGGMVEVPSLGLKWQLSAYSNRVSTLPSAIAIVLILVAVSAFLPIRHMKVASENIVFGLLAAAAAFRVTMVSDLVWDYFPMFALTNKYNLEYASFSFVGLFYYLYVVIILRPGTRQLIDYVIVLASLLLIIFALMVAPVLPPGSVTLIREAGQIIWLTVVVYTFVMAIKYSRRGHSRRLNALIFTMSGILYTFYEIASISGVIPFALEWSQALILAMVILHIQALIMYTRRLEQERNELHQKLYDQERLEPSLDSRVKTAEKAKL